MILMARVFGVSLAFFFLIDYILSYGYVNYYYYKGLYKKKRA